MKVSQSDSKLYEEAVRFQKDGCFLEAISKARQLESGALKGGILVDAGASVRKSSIVQEGINLFLQAVEDRQTPFAKLSLYYNLGNGYCALYDLKRRNKKSLVPTNDHNLRQAKHFYRKSIAELSTEKFGSMRSQVWTNYGNCLSAFGRTVEAISAFNEAISSEPRNGIALASLARELEYFSRIVGRYRHQYILQSHAIVTKALSKRAHLEYGNITFRERFQHFLEYLQEIIDAHEEGIPPLRRTTLPKGLNRKYVQFCHRHDLYLNAWSGDPKYAPAVSDDIHFGPIATSLVDDITAPSLLRTLNEIKESYASARYLLYLSQSDDKEMNAISKLSWYDDFNARDLNGLPVGLLKTAYGRAFEVLDKVARLVNLYFKVGNERLGFWDTFAIRESRGESHATRFILRPELAQLNNYGLFALGDLSIDYHEDENTKFKQIDSRRNLITHRYLTVMYDEYPDKQRGDEVGIAELMDQVINVLRLAKSAILYGVISINIAETNRKYLDDKVHPKFTYRSVPGYISIKK